MPKQRVHFLNGLVAACLLLSVHAPTFASSSTESGAALLSKDLPSIMVAPSITAVSYAKPNLFISGSGFSASGNIVTINGQDVSKSIKDESETSIIVKGPPQKLGLRSGPNQIQVTDANGSVSNVFVLNL